MVRLIGLTLLLYGLAGVGGAVALNTWLTGPQGPVERLRNFLARVSEQITQAKEVSGQASGFAASARQALDDVSRQLGDVVPPLQQLFEALSGAASFIRSAETGLNSVSVTVPAQTTTTLPDLSVDLPTVNGISATRYGSVAGLDIYGPPYSVETGTKQGVIPGPSNVPWLTTTSVQPLQGVAGVVGQVAGEVEKARDRVADVRTTVENIRTAAEDGKVSIDGVRTLVLDPLPGELDNLKGEVDNAKDSTLLTTLPRVVLLYFGLIHLAFALTGFAFLIV